MDSIEKKLQTTREFADMYVEELQKIQEELWEAGAAKREERRRKREEKASAR